ncbi:hypothetical protein BHM03_00030673 [Ensete ventricosum]|nr:hypothetical protein BHM03_00030673 [Ensete ventricosum]
MAKSSRGSKSRSVIRSSKPPQGGLELSRPWMKTCTRSHLSSSTKSPRGSGRYGSCGRDVWESTASPETMEW